MTTNIYHWHQIAQHLPNGPLRRQIESAATGWPGSLVMTMQDLSPADLNAIREANQRIPRRTWATRGLQVPEMVR